MFIKLSHLLQKTMYYLIVFNIHYVKLFVASNLFLRNPFTSKIQGCPSHGNCITQWNVCFGYFDSHVRWLLNFPVFWVWKVQAT